ncbi:DtxR family iron (metal) dependent repressor [Glaciihabitans tibetensis]|uniref:Manganese transport regulator n=1 Tax=Glaciihabitans tibetensis TaxID=1266600 RepID=A0A2T0VH36_9MICO|nr:metal-dependent transcriptional regulator [Glaciihabitans tibetensis]PRY69481.1 DtxR family iron (metal) dependent repressor [Glaciihabitans tibetensis]
MKSQTAVEDYVKVIYNHTEWQNVPITTSALAARLGLAASSVTEMVKKLGAQGLVTHVPYGAVTLTVPGTTLALRMLRRHRLIETWLVRQYGYGWDEVHDEAEVLEHSLSDRLLDAIDDQLGHPVRDPHGDPIPSREGTIVQPRAVLLRDATEGVTARVVRISDSDPTLLRHLAAEAITLDSELTVLGRKPFGGSFVVRVGRGDLGEQNEGEQNEGERDLGEQALASIWVSVGQAE